jgi:hypothetical protein
MLRRISATHPASAEGGADLRRSLSLMETTLINLGTMLATGISVAPA